RRPVRAPPARRRRGRALGSDRLGRRPPRPAVARPLDRLRVPASERARRLLRDLRRRSRSGPRAPRPPARPRLRRRAPRLRRRDVGRRPRARGACLARPSRDELSSPRGTGMLLSLAEMTFDFGGARLRPVEDRALLTFLLDNFLYGEVAANQI